jgi:hypothetical protein
VNDIVIYAVFDVRGVFAVPNKRALLDSFRMNSSWGAPRCADNNPPAICEKAVGIVGAYYGASIRCAGQSHIRRDPHDPAAGIDVLLGRFRVHRATIRVGQISEKEGGL